MYQPPPPPPPKVDFSKTTTRELRRILAIAHETAQRGTFPAVGAEHLLFALLKVQAEGGSLQPLFRKSQIEPSLLLHNLEQGLNLSSEVKYPQRLPLTPSAKALLVQGDAEAKRLRHRQMDSGHLLLAFLSEPHSSSYIILTQEVGFVSEMVYTHLNVSEDGLPLWWSRYIPVSPVFLLIVLATLVAGMLLYHQIGNIGVLTALFVAGGWLITLALHEFGHAFVAYHGGDHSVRKKGYLTLNPLAYTHPMLSIAMPLMFLMIGGLGLPGGAVYIYIDKLRSRAWQIFGSAAGPLMSLLCTVLVCLPFVVANVATIELPPTPFWAALALLAYIELVSLVLTLLPIPPLDGYGILAPYLPQSVRKGMGQLGNYGFVIFYLALLVPNPVTEALWRGIASVQVQLGISPLLVQMGFHLFRFWE